MSLIFYKDVLRIFRFWYIWIMKSAKWLFYRIFLISISREIGGKAFWGILLLPLKFLYKKFHLICLTGCWIICFSVLNLQKQSPEVFYERAVFKNFAIFTGRHLCWSSFLIKLQAWIPILKNIYEWLLLNLIGSLQEGKKFSF